MQCKSLMLSVVFFLGFGLITLQAQESVNATGGNVSGNGGAVSYSIGQPFYSTHTSNNGFEIQGVQQPYEISEVIGIEEVEEINLSVYPNPTTDFLRLKVDKEPLKGLSFQLVDMNGKLLQVKKLMETDNQINMKSYVPSTYFLSIIKHNQCIKKFKIIKN